MTTTSFSQWTPAHQAQAIREGWALFNQGAIQRLDDERIFISDDTALAHVEQWAASGSELHALALRCHREDLAEQELSRVEQMLQSLGLQADERVVEALLSHCVSRCAVLVSQRAAERHGYDKHGDGQALRYAFGLDLDQPH